MCYQYNSPIDVSVVPCPMCKVFKPSGARCPHLRDVCYNRANHPRLDVVHLKNAEVKSFNGCGYCKWARSNPKLTVYNNQGWPGCCRPPTSNEQRLIQPADWPTVSIVHNIPIPPEIKSVLDSILSKGSSLPAMISSTSTSSRNQPTQPSLATLDRRNSSNSPTNKPSPTSSKSQPVSIPVRARSNGSPVQQASALTGTTPRSSASLITNVTTDQHHSLSRRQTFTEGTKEKSRTPSTRRAVDLEGSLSRRSGATRLSISSVAPSFSPSRGPSDSPPQYNTLPPVPHPSPVDSYTTSLQDASFGRNLSSKKSSLESAMAALEVASSSESSSDSGSSRGSMSDATVISDGAFTDYLSDESEAELQRQAEAKAALVAQNQAEELEFKAARQQLVGVGLRPPKAWDDTNESLPRATSHASAYTHHSAYHYAAAPVAHSARG